MIVGIIFIIIALVGMYFSYTTDYDDDMEEMESFGKIKLYTGLIILFLVGLVSIISDIKKSV